MAESNAVSYSNSTIQADMGSRANCAKLSIENCICMEWPLLFDRLPLLR